MAYSPGPEGKMNTKLKVKPIVEKTMSSDSKNVVLSSNPAGFQGSQCNDNTATRPRRRRKKRQHLWGPSRYRQKKNTSKQLQISRAVYPVSYQYTLEGFTQNKDTEKFSSKRAIGVAPTASETTLSDSKKVIVSGNPVEPQDFKYTSTVYYPSNQKTQKWTTAHCTQRRKLAQENTNSSMTSQSFSRSETTREKLYSRTPTATILSGASTVDDIEKGNNYDSWLHDHPYSVPNCCDFHSPYATSCSTITADEDTNSKEEAFEISAPSLEESAESTSCVDLHLLVIEPSVGTDVDASFVSDQSTGKDNAEVDEIAQIDDVAQIKNEVLSVSSEASDSGTPSFWDKLEASVRAALPFPWMTRPSDGKLSLMRIPVRNNIAVQIGITIDSSETHYFVHNRPLPFNHKMRTYGRHIGTLTLREAVDSVLKVVSTVDTLKVCPGARDYKEFWNKITDGFVEENLFSEDEGNFKILRSQNCTLLVRWTSACDECKKLACRLRRFKSQAMNRPLSQDPSKFSPKQYLSSAEQMRKLADLQKIVKSQNKKIARLTKKEDLQNVLQQQ